ncbi:MAG: hypothetical protein KBF57_13860 [Saprospiraceae bacterium]|nr:hypothetical protein [Saprospiraceae bacterium]MBP9195765.1 hypothetical protein [Saprospiraceae bacterium]
MDTNLIQVICLGHSCHDLVNEGYHPGGTVTYASLLAKNLGAEVTVITSTGPDFLFQHLFSDKGIQWHNLPAEQTTCFTNTPSDNGRKQKISAVASQITSGSLSFFPKTEILHLGPIANEIDPDVIQLFPNALIGLSIQGWLRNWDSDGNVFTQNMDWKHLKGIDLVFASEEDLAHDPNVIYEITEHVPAVILTRGAKGAVIFSDKQEILVPAFPIKESDATGAGDSFAISFLMHYYKSGDLIAACQYAHCVASLVVEGQTLPSLPLPEDVSHRFQQYKDHFNI